MARRIIWTSNAEKIFSQILSFYYKRNGNKIYSRKLYIEIKQILNLIRENPFIGREINNVDIRVLVSGNFKIFYKIEPQQIIILMIWDCRQNPEDLRI